MSTKDLLPIGTKVRAVKDSTWCYEGINDITGLPVFQRDDVGTIIDHCIEEPGEDYYVRWDIQKVMVEDGTWYALKHEVEAIA